MDSSLSISVVSRPTIKLFGVFIRTDMSNAQRDCSQLWEKEFGPRMHEVSGLPCTEFPGESYGLSILVDLDKGIFDYWAAMAPGAGITLSQGMSEVEVPEGLYAFCKIPSLQSLNKTYSFMYEEWLPQQNDYHMNMQAPCFELYGKDYLKNGSLEVYVPVLKS